MKDFQKELNCANLYWIPRSMWIKWLSISTVFKKIDTWYILDLFANRYVDVIKDILSDGEQTIISQTLTTIQSTLNHI